MAVEFEYWGESEIGNRMASEFIRGRYWFWFNEERLSNEWFRSRIDEAVANARDRFSPEINVELPIRGVFDALGRTPRFYKKLEGLYSEAYIKYKSLRVPVDPLGSTDSPDESVRTLAVQLFANMEPWISNGSDYAEWTATRPVPWVDIQMSARELMAAMKIRISEINNLLSQQNGESQKTPDKPIDDLSWELHYLRDFNWSIAEILACSDSDESRVSNLPYLLLTGDAGQGKTHLLCQIAREETDEYCPRVMFHGEQFRNEEPWSQMIRLLGLDCSPEDAY